MSEAADNLRVLRALDKADRMPPLDIFALLTGGRRDQSGDFMPGCGLTSAQACVLTSFVFSTKEPRLQARLFLIDKLDEIEIGGGRTAWDLVLEWFTAMPEPKNIAWVIDDLIDHFRKGTP